MSHLVVEDGTGKTTANSYATKLEADNYFTTRGNLTWIGTDEIKESALIRATDYIEARFSQRFKGRLEFPDNPQALSFPRLDLFDREGRSVLGVPTKLKSATIEYALKALTENLFLEPTIDETGLTPTLIRSKVGPIEDEIEYAHGDTQKTIKPFPMADRLISQFITASGSSIRA